MIAWAVLINDIVVEGTLIRGDDGSLIASKLRSQETFEDVMEREDPVGPNPKGFDVLGADQHPCKHRAHSDQ